jgi:hypothetical protein
MGICGVVPDLKATTDSGEDPRGGHEKHQGGIEMCLEADGTRDFQKRTCCSEMMPQDRLQRRYITMIVGIIVAIVCQVLKILPSPPHSIRPVDLFAGKAWRTVRERR